MLRRCGAGGAEHVDHPIHDLSRPTRIAGGVRHIHDVGAGAGRDAHTQDQATDRGVTARHAQQALAHTGPLRDREPDVTERHGDSVGHTALALDLAAVPEPTTMLFGFALVGSVALGRARSRMPVTV